MPGLGLALLGSLVIGVSVASASPEPVSHTPDEHPVLSGDPQGSVPLASADLIRTDDDPFQTVNRASFRFSSAVDRALIGPVAHGYVRFTPRPLRDRVSAFVLNLREPSTALNDLAQAHGTRAARTTSRFAINSTIGLLGLFDVASGLGLPGHNADFGQTLGRYGLKTGPFLYVPVIGPVDVRDGVGRVVDLLIDPVSLVAGGSWTSGFRATRTVVSTLDRRVYADNAYKALEDATDPYVTTRSGYLQYRGAVVRQATGETQDLPDFDPQP
jgi:phospholipid-binding lipoprotein MlaA